MISVHGFNSIWNLLPQVPMEPFLYLVQYNLKVLGYYLHDDSSKVFLTLYLATSWCTYAATVLALYKCCF